MEYSKHNWQRGHLSLPLTFVSVFMRQTAGAFTHRSVTFIAFVMLIGMQSGGALWAAPLPKSIEALKRQKATLEVELAKVNEQIQEIESGASRSISETAPSYYIKDFGIEEVNSAGGVEPHATFVNPNPKLVVKYIRLRATAYNAVGDVVSSSIDGTSTAGMYMTGPLSHDDGERRAGWEPIWYNHSATCLKIQSVQVEFVGGKKLSFAGNTLRAALSPNLKNDCKV
jgi:hypothetical protein